MEKTIRYSKKRAAILAAIRETNCHPTAEWVFQTLKPAHPDLSLGTVYRNLVFFRERGEIQSVGVFNGQEHFDAVTTPHTHFVCRGCGSVQDLKEIQLSDELDRDVSRRCGLSIDRHQLTFHGLCQSCTPEII